MMKIEESLPYGFEDTSYQAAGGAEGIARLVNAFYNYVESLPNAAALRAMHQESLDSARDKLALFLSGWLGGPKTYHQKYGSINIPLAHKPLNINQQTADMWLMCMDKAIDQQPYSAKFASYLKSQFRVPVERILAVQ